MLIFFLQSGEGVIRAYDSLRTMCQEAQLTAPHRITSTNLRKYMATVTQASNVCTMHLLSFNM